MYNSSSYDYEPMLDKQQRRIVNDVNDYQVVEGCAGSGKTLVLINRINRLIELGINPDDILIISFSKEAIKEIKNRLDYLIECRTVHSYCYKILTNELDRVNVISEAQRMYYIRNAMNALGMKEEITDVSLSISQAKNRLLNKINDKTVNLVYQVYEQRKMKNNLIDYDDYMIEAIKVLRRTSKYRRKYILVDEAHDLSYSQFRVLELIANSNVTLFASRSQSIYQWRAAQPELIDAFVDVHNAVVYHLKNNYRSCSSIIDFSNELIKDSKYSISMDTIRKEIGRVVYHGHYKSINDEINRAIYSIRSNSAILYRVNWYSMYLEKALRKSYYAYSVLGNTSIFDNPEIIHLLNYIKLSIDMNNYAALTDVYNVPRRGLGLKWHERFSRSYLKDRDVISALSSRTNRKSWDKGQKDMLYNLYVIRHICQSSYDVLCWIRDKMKYKDYISKSYLIDADSINEFIDFSKGYNKEELLSICSTPNNDNHNLVIGTGHQVKGLEYSNVILVGITDGIIPAHKSKNIDEELRLLYVMATRAKDSLIYSSASHKQFNKPSRFIR